jgi:hypothetical protein
VVKERDQERNKKKELGPAECRLAGTVTPGCLADFAGWFCLSNPKVTKHLVTAIGKETYMTLPKGQIIPTFPRHLGKGESGPLVPGGGHVLVS